MPCWHYSLGPLGTPRFQFLDPPIAYHYISVLHITYSYILSYCTLGHPIHYGQLNPWANP
ncbi:hypothetical protein PAXRUDRAFT_173981 [Paxillus rubicundulus Ve08.2h10]|uniref:Uncharacterized protein n=1 Tax=Paxillus rubicundulus Ve08.2h10 TaxID=930991 RepID=A0A0D0CIN8_9AGAM|nr:hypothetical protein PAXRUDRAFT_173981 [Paxillus rubicundulus Ve08.2h10]